MYCWCAANSLEICSLIAAANDWSAIGPPVRERVGATVSSCVADGLSPSQRDSSMTSSIAATTVSGAPRQLLVTQSAQRKPASAGLGSSGLVARPSGTLGSL